MSKEKKRNRKKKQYEIRQINNDKITVIIHTYLRNTQQTKSNKKNVIAKKEITTSQSSMQNDIKLFTVKNKVKIFNNKMSKMQNFYKIKKNKKNK